MRPLFEKLEAILAREEYCPTPEIDRLREQAASLNPVSDAAEKKELYLRIARLLTERGGQNRMRYCNPQVDRLIVEAERVTDRPTKIKLYSQIQKTCRRRASADLSLVSRKRSGRARARRQHPHRAFRLVVFHYKAHA